MRIVEAFVQELAEGVGAGLINEFAVFPIVDERGDAAALEIESDLEEPVFQGFRQRHGFLCRGVCHRHVGAVAIGGDIGGEEAEVIACLGCRHQFAAVHFLQLGDRAIGQGGQRYLAGTRPGKRIPDDDAGAIDLDRTGEGGELFRQSLVDQSGAVVDVVAMVVERSEQTGIDPFGQRLLPGFVVAEFELVGEKPPGMFAVEQALLVGGGHGGGLFWRLDLPGLQLGAEGIDLRRQHPDPAGQRSLDRHRANPVDPGIRHVGSEHWQPGFFRLDRLDKVVKSPEVQPDRRQFLGGLFAQGLDLGGSGWTVVVAGHDDRQVVLAGPAGGRNDLGTVVGRIVDEDARAIRPFPPEEFGNLRPFAGDVAAKLQKMDAGMP